MKIEYNLPMLLKMRWSALAVLVLGAIFAVAAKEYVAPRAQAANTYAAHDAHPSEGVTIAADPYDAAGKADIFTVPFTRSGFLPIYLVVSNDNDQPVTLARMQLELVTANKSKIPPAIADDIQRRFRSGGPQSSEPQRPQLPLPIPRGPKVPKSQSRDAVEQFNEARFAAKAVEPHANRAGFFFFDVAGIREPLAGAHLYVTGVRDDKGQELMFFDISMDKYLSTK